MQGSALHTVLLQLSTAGGALAMPATLAVGNGRYTDPVPAGGVRCPSP